MTITSRRRPKPIRTYAEDLEAARLRRDRKDGAEPEAVETSVPEPTVAAPIPKSAPAVEAKPIVSAKDVPAEKPKGKPLFSKPILPASAPAAKSTTKIPAFHELEKKSSVIQENISVIDSAEDRKQIHKKISKLAKETTTSRPNIGYDALVITDTKSNRFRFLPSVIESLRAWFKKLSASRKQKAVPKYTVPEAERRKGVIQRATSKTGTIFTADSETLKEQIRKRQHEQELQAEDDAETTWSPFTDPGYPLLEPPGGLPDVTLNVKVEYRKKPQFVEPSVDTPVVPVVPSIPEEVEPEVLEKMEPSTLPEVLEPEPELSDEDLLAEARWAAEDGPEQMSSELPEAVEESPEPEPVPEPESAETRTTSQSSGFGFGDANTLTIVLLVSIVVVAAVIFTITVTVKHFSQAPAGDPSVEITIEPNLKQATLVGISLTAQTLNQIPQLLDDAIASSSAGLVEFALVSSLGEEVSASYLFELLRFRTMASLRQSLLSARFVTVNHSTPGLVLEFVDLDTVRGGLLNWETAMPDDFRTLYDIPQETTPGFVDETIEGIDVRVLRHNDTSVLVYGIIDTNTAIIAPNTASFAQILELSASE